MLRSWSLQDGNPKAVQAVLNYNSVFYRLQYYDALFSLVIIWKRYYTKIPLFLPHGSILPEWRPGVTSNVSYSVNSMESYFINWYPVSRVVGKRLRGGPGHQHPAGRLWVSGDGGAQGTYFCVRSRRGVITSTYISWPRTRSCELIDLCAKDSGKCSLCLSSSILQTVICGRGAHIFRQPQWPVPTPPTYVMQTFNIKAENSITFHSLKCGKGFV